MPQLVVLEFVSTHTCEQHAGAGPTPLSFTPASSELQSFVLLHPILHEKIPDMSLSQYCPVGHGSGNCKHGTHVFDGTSQYLAIGSLQSTLLEHVVTHVCVFESQCAGDMQSESEQPRQVCVFASQMGVLPLHAGLQSVAIIMPPSSPFIMVSSVVAVAQLAISTKPPSAKTAPRNPRIAMQAFYSTHAASVSFPSSLA
jgi:hypothetical protein